VASDKDNDDKILRKADKSSDVLKGPFDAEDSGNQKSLYYHMNEV